MSEARVRARCEGRERRDGRTVIEGSEVASFSYGVLHLAKLLVHSSDLPSQTTILLVQNAHCRPIRSVFAYILFHHDHRSGIIVDRGIFAI
jgi:hypothetical protein